MNDDKDQKVSLAGQALYQSYLKGNEIKIPKLGVTIKKGDVGPIVKPIVKPADKPVEVKMYLSPLKRLIIGIGLAYIGLLIILGTWNGC